MSVEIGLNTGNSVKVPSVTLRAEPDLRCVCIRDKLLPFAILDTSDNVVLQGSVQDRVCRSLVTGHLHFSHRIKTRSTGIRKIIQVFRRNFRSSVFVGWRYDGLGTTEPINALRAQPAMISFEFFSGRQYDGLPVGGSSRFFYIKTEATRYDTLGETILVTNGSEKITLKTAQPGGRHPVPP